MLFTSRSYIYCWIFDKFSIFEARISLHILDYQVYWINLLANDYCVLCVRENETNHRELLPPGALFEFRILYESQQ